MKSLNVIRHLSFLIALVMLASCVGYVEGPGPDRLPPSNDPAESSSADPEVNQDTQELAEDTYETEGADDGAAGASNTESD